MKTISIVNLKGGVAKTITSTNLAFNLAEILRKDVLLIDNDKQGSASKFYKKYSSTGTGLAEVLQGVMPIDDVIQFTDFRSLDILTANMGLLKADRSLLLETIRPKHAILKTALSEIKDDYDYCVIDCAPDINMSVLNALVASDAVIIPVKVDMYSFDGVYEILEQINEVKKYYNPDLKFLGVVVTSYRNDEVNNEGVKMLSQKFSNIFKTQIRWTAKVDESTFMYTPLEVYSKRCGAAKDYLAFTNEVIERLG